MQSLDAPHLLIRQIHILALLLADEAALLDLFVQPFLVLLVDGTTSIGFARLSLDALLGISDERLGIFNLPVY